MKSAKKIEELLSKINVTDAGRSNEKLNEILAAQEKSQKTSSAVSGPNIWRIIMTNKTVRVATAAIIIIAAVIGINYFGGSIDGAGVVLADVVENMKKMPWIHAKVTMDYTGTKVTYETWKCFKPSIDVTVHGDGAITYYDFSKKKMHEYNPGSNTIRISPKTDEYNLPGPGSPTEMIPAILENARKENAEIIREKNELDGVSVEIISIVSKNLNGTLVCDIERNLVLTMESEAVIPENGKKVTSEATFYYPDEGPRDIYALGVPEEAIVIDTVPKGTLKDLTDELQRRFDNGIGDHTAVILDSHVDDDGVLRPSLISIMRQQGKLKRFDQYFAFDSSKRRDKLKSLYEDVKDRWPEFTIEQIEAVVKDEALERQILFDGKQSYLLSRFSGQVQKQEIRTDIFKVSPSDCLAGVIWVNPQVVMLGNADSDETLELLEPDTDHAGLRGFRVIRTVGKKKNKGGYQPPEGTVDYWFDPEKNYMLVEKIINNEIGDIGGIANYRYVVDKTAKTSDGKWYPAVISTETVYISKKGKKSNRKSLKYVLIDVEKKADPNLFDPESLIK